MNTETLTERQKLILGLVVQEYVENAKPVGSKRLVKRYNLGFSSATVRNEMARLSDLGFLRTKAGRIPTEDGYRFIVSQYLQRPALSPPETFDIQELFLQAGQDIHTLMRLSASVLARQVRAASLVTAPQTPHARFKHLELILISGRQVLMVLVIAGGEVRQPMFVLGEPVPQEQLSVTAQKLNQLFAGKSSEEIDKIPADLDALTDDMFKLVLAELQQAHKAVAGEVYHDGWTNVLANPEFAVEGAANKALRVFEEHSYLEDLLSQTVLNDEVGDVQVLIGGEGHWEDLSDFSLVLARYGRPDIATGILGVLGPVRMPYGQAISAVNYIGGLLTTVISETHGWEE